MRSRREALAVTLAAMLVVGTGLACKGGSSKKVPKGPREEVGALETTRRAWVGDWEGNGATLHIEPKGYLTFTKKSGGANTSYNGPIHHFEGDDVVLDIVVSTVTLEVQKPPHTDADGKARMTIEGVEVTQFWTATAPVPKK